MLSMLANSDSLQRPKTVCAVILIFFALPAILYGSYSFNKYKQVNRFEENVAHISHDVGERINKIRTLMASLVGLNNVSPDLDNNKLQLFSKEVINNSDYITTLGRFERVLHARRGAFESEMTDTGLFNFRITQIDDNGRVKVSPDSSVYYPISMIEPMNPGNTRMVGADFAAVPGLSDKLDIITANNTSVIAALPDTWPYDGDLVAFRTVYRGKETPEGESDRLAQAAGGFWASVDLSKLVSAG